MASPPFNIAETVPGDSDIASQFPATERTFRDIVESWFLVQGNVQGRTNVLMLDDQGSSPSGTADVTKIWADSNGNLNYRIGTGDVTRLGVPAGAVIDYAGSTEPPGWLFPYGQAVSRTTYADLFAAIGTTYGSGDGSTTFNLPDYRGRVGVGKDNMGGSAAGRVTAAGSGLAGTTLGATGGAQSHTLTTAQLPAHSHGVTDPGHTHPVTHDAARSFGGALAQGGINTFGAAASISTVSAATGITIKNTGGGGAHNNMQPSIIVNKLIKI